MKKTRLIAVVMLITLSGIVLGIFVRFSYCDEDLRGELEAAFVKLKEATEVGDLKGFEESLSTHNYVTLQNNLSSAQIELDEEFLKGYLDSDDELGDYQFVKTYRNGPTAGILYVIDLPKEDWEDSSIPEVIFSFRKFVYEEDAWKLHALANSYENKYQEDGNVTEYDLDGIVMIAETLAIDGIIPEAPALLTQKPDYSGSMWVSPSNSTLKITINGVLQGEYKEGTSSTGMIDGGLKKGGNTIEIEVGNVDREVSSTSRIEIKLFDSDKVIFMFDPWEPVEGAFSATFDPEGDPVVLSPPEEGDKEFHFDLTNPSDAVRKYVLEKKGFEFYKVISGVSFGFGGGGGKVTVTYATSDGKWDRLVYWAIRFNPRYDVEEEYQVYEKLPTDIDHPEVFDYLSEKFFQKIYGEGYNSLASAYPPILGVEMDDGDTVLIGYDFTVDYRPASIQTFLKEWTPEGPPLYTSRLIFMKQDRHWQIHKVRVQKKISDTKDDTKDFEEVGLYERDKIENILFEHRMNDAH